MSDTVRIGDTLVERAHFRTHLNAMLSRLAAASPGRWDGPLFRWCLSNNRIIAAAAVYRTTGCRILFLWIFGRLVSTHLWCPRHTDAGKRSC